MIAEVFLGPDLVVEIMRKMLVEAMVLSTPMLVATCVVSLAVSLVQTLTSVQEQTLSTVPRLVVVFVVAVVTLPWMVHRLVGYTVRLLADFHRYLG